jgi:HTH-type transcriptional regulator / antitoxin HigA
MTSTHPFEPDWVSPPGDTIEDLLDDLGMSKAQLAQRTGFTPKHINELVHGRAPLTPAAAVKLATVLGSTAEFWLTREAQYRAALEHKATIDALREHKPWLSQLPLAWMVTQGWVRRLSHQGAQVWECLRWFGVADVPAWEAACAAPLAAYRASSTASQKRGAVAAWLRQAELEAHGIDTQPYDKRAFDELLPQLRQLCSEPDPGVFAPRIVQACAAVGVAVVFVPRPPGCPLHGATRWLGPRKAMLALSLRYKSHDQLWFSFFHEAFHILRHGKKLLILEGMEGLDPALEAEADQLAGDLLIPPSSAKILATLFTEGEFEALAKDIGVHPGILVGRAQRERWIPYQRLNHLKLRYEWVQDEDGRDG